MKPIVSALLGGVLLMLVAAAAMLEVVDRPLLLADHAGPALPQQLPAAAPPAGLRFTVFQTAHSAAAPEALVVAGGRWGQPRQLVQQAVLIRHPRGNLLYDTGLGRQIAAQFAVNSAFYRRFFAHAAVNPLVDQMAAHGESPQDIRVIVPSHMHWDHISALPDLPWAQVWAEPAERQGAHEGEPPAFLASQFEGVQHWRDLHYTDGPYLGFARSRDVHGDGSIVLVPLPGHTRGQVGLFLTLPSGRRYFFIGDATWTIEGVNAPADRPWLTRHLVHLDDDETLNRNAIAHIHHIARAYPAMQVVPVHDEHVARQLPRYPNYQE